VAKDSSNIFVGCKNNRLYLLIQDILIKGNRELLEMLIFGLLLSIPPPPPQSINTAEWIFKSFQSVTSLYLSTYMSLQKVQKKVGDQTSSIGFNLRNYSTD
jgi:hypothetical protein